MVLVLVLFVICPSLASAQYALPFRRGANGCVACSASWYFQHGPARSDAGVVTVPNVDWADGGRTYTNSVRRHYGTDFAIGWGRRVDGGFSDSGDAIPPPGSMNVLPNWPRVDVLAPIDGQVIRAYDGCDDRCSSGSCGSTCAGGGSMGNSVQMLDRLGRRLIFMHLRNGSVPVSLLSATSAAPVRVSCGDLLGQAGSSGDSSGVHLHFEVQENGVAIDPFAGVVSGVSTLWNIDQGPYAGLPPATCYCPSPQVHVYPGEFESSATRPSYATQLTWEVSRAYGRATRGAGVLNANPITYPLGCPPSPSAEHPSPHVHQIPVAASDIGGGSRSELDHIWVQDFVQMDSGRRFPDSTDGETAVVYNPRLQRAFLIRTGAWGLYRCMRWNSRPVGGAEYLGAPRDEEHIILSQDEITSNPALAALATPPAVGVSIQTFERGYITYTNNCKLK